MKEGSGLKAAARGIASRGDDEGPDVIQWQLRFVLPIRPTGDKPPLTAQNGAVLKNVENVVAHGF